MSRHSNFIFSAVDFTNSPRHHDLLWVLVLVHDANIGTSTQPYALNYIPPLIQRLHTQLTNQTSTFIPNSGARSSESRYGLCTVLSAYGVRRKAPKALTIQNKLWRFTLTDTKTQKSLRQLQSKFKTATNHESQPVAQTQKRYVTLCQASQPITGTNPLARPKLNEPPHLNCPLPSQPAFPRLPPPVSRVDPAFTL